MRYGAYSHEVIDRLKWMEMSISSSFQSHIKISRRDRFKTMTAQALQMGDEGHNRNKAGTSLLIRELAPYLVYTEFSNEDKWEVLKFIHSNDHFS